MTADLSYSTGRAGVCEHHKNKWDGKKKGSDFFFCCRSNTITRSPLLRAIGVSHTACKDEFRQNIQSHSWSVFSFSI